MKSRGAPHLIDVNNLRVACSSCSLRELCLPAGPEAAEMAKIGRLVSLRRRVRKGEHLYHAGAPPRGRSHL